jgi:hypothetical protein
LGSGGGSITGGVVFGGSSLGTGGFSRGGIVGRVSARRRVSMRPLRQEGHCVRRPHGARGTRGS